MLPSATVANRLGPHRKRKLRIVEMSQIAAGIEACPTHGSAQPRLNGDTRRRLGSALRVVYENSCDTQPIPDAQVDLLLQLRHRERDLRRAG